jgi:4-diphosphocytidyl-2-C-methyl-D-erythritol kinase
MSSVEGKRVGSKALLELTEGLSLGLERVLSAPAKVNLRLKVIGRRPDGYHLLSMLNVSTSLADEVCVALTRDRSVALRIEPTMAIPGDVRDNSVIRAWSSFWDEFSEDGAPCGVSVAIRKRIPVGGGLGGGSSDAAAMLRFLAETCGVNLCRFLGLDGTELDKRMMKVALTIGADVPYAYRAGICWVTGIGEQVARLPAISPWPGEVLITMPPAAVPTVEFYRFFREQQPVLRDTTDAMMEGLADGGAPVSCVGLLGNDFEPAVAAFRPVVGAALRLAREHYPETTSLTGSGAAIFSLVTPEQASSVPTFCGAMEAQGMVVHRTRMLAARYAR